jgi:hypothetical protein
MARASLFPPKAGKSRQNDEINHKTAIIVIASMLG